MTMEIDRYVGKNKRTVVFLLFCLIEIFIFIVNNRNILSDGRDERGYLQRKYNEM